MCQAGKCIVEGSAVQTVLAAWLVLFVSWWNPYSLTMLLRSRLLAVPSLLQFFPYVPPTRLPKDRTDHQYSDEWGLFPESEAVDTSWMREALDDQRTPLQVLHGHWDYWSFRFEEH
jgi:hypothetical protein